MHIVPSFDSRQIFADPEPAFAEVVAAFGVDGDGIDAEVLAEV